MKRISLRMPDDMHALVDATVTLTQRTNRKYSLNDWLLDASSAYLNRAIPPPKLPAPVADAFVMPWEEAD